MSEERTSIKLQNGNDLDYGIDDEYKNNEAFITIWRGRFGNTTTFSLEELEAMSAILPVLIDKVKQLKKVSDDS